MKEKQSMRELMVQEKKHDMREKEVITMKKGLRIRPGAVMLLFLMAIAGIVLMPQLQASAAVNCTSISPSSTVDTDGDGYYDYEECYGFTTPTAAVIKGSTNCGAGDICMNPDVQDLFVIIVPAAGSLLPSDPLVLISTPVAQGGLGILVHQVAPSFLNTDRVVVSRADATFEKAVRITEDNTTPLLDPTTEPLAICQYGTPNGLDAAAIFTKRVHDSIDQQCAGAGTCKDNVSGATLASSPSLYDVHIRQTIAHEIGHMLKLTDVYVSSYGGYHYKAGSGTIMQQFNSSSSKGGTVTYAIPNKYNAGSRSTAGDADKDHLY